MRVLTVIVLLSVLAVANAADLASNTPAEGGDFVFAEIVDDVKAHMDAWKNGEVPMAAVETSAEARPAFAPGAPGAYAYAGAAVPPAAMHPYMHPAYAHNYLSAMHFMAQNPGAPGAPSVAGAYATYGFPYSSYPPIPPPMPTYLPPPPYVPEAF